MFHLLYPKVNIRKLFDFFKNGFGWGTWTRTRINGVRDRRPTIRRFPILGVGPFYNHSNPSLQVLMIMIFYELCLRRCPYCPHSIE